MDLSAQSLATATALPARWYCDPSTVALERAAIFDRAWHLLGHASRLRDPGDHVVADCGGLPVIAVRGADGVVRAFHNVCRHRAGPIAQCDGLAAKSLRCRYHGWTYALDGQLKSAPEMQSAEGFDVAEVRLPELAVREWQGLVFGAVDAARAMPFEELVAGIDARIGARAGKGGRGLAGYGHHRHVAYDIACNWKAYIDNYLEGYHVPHVHPALNRMLDYRSYRTELAQWHSLQWSPLESDPALYGDGEALYYWLWPNTTLNILPGRLQTNRVVPLAVDRCRVEFDFYYPLAESGVGGEGADDDGELRARRDADRDFSDAVQLEDLRICEDVQRGLASGSYVAGRLNPLRESGVFHFQELLRAAYRDAPA
ncbi:MAG: aromatic ring-hydroxylating oxygenase subunit alpha [Luteimonas sp.]